MYLDNPLSPPEAKKLLRQILQKGRVIFGKHAREEMENDGLAEGDCMNVLRGGIIDPPELHGSSNSWRYRVHTMKIWVVITFVSETKTVVVTAWRK